MGDVSVPVLHVCTRGTLEHARLLVEVQDKGFLPLQDLNIAKVLQHGGEDTFSTWGT